MDKSNEYIGDGVYVSYDGYYIRISINDHRNEPVVALEPEVLQGLINYAKKLDIKLKI